MRDIITLYPQGLQGRKATFSSAVLNPSAFPICSKYGDYGLIPMITGAVVTLDHVTVLICVTITFLLSVIVIRKNRITFNFKLYK